MRALFLLLVLTVAGVWAWENWVRGPGLAAVPATELKAPALKLWSELTPGQKKALNLAVDASAAPGHSTPAEPAPVSPQAPVAAAGPTTPVCASIGPFQASDSAADAAERLSGDGYSVSQRTIPGKVRVGYWVFLPEYASRSEAETAVARLKNRGVRDLYIVADSAHRNAISLGVYSEKSGAEQRAAAIRKLGFKARVSDRFRDAPVYWLDILAVNGSLPDLSRSTLDSGGPDPVQMEPHDCPGGAVAGEGAKP